MVTAAALAVAEELLPLGSVASSRGWGLILIESTTFILNLPAKDRSLVQLLVDCDAYPAAPPAWHFRNPETGELDQRRDIPRGGTFFHSSGVICAPWNRLAYHPHGPHDNWAISDWRANPQAGGAKTLCAMALRLAVELQGPYEGRLA